MKNYHFGGWATRNDLPCGDGRVIRRDAFRDQDGQEVPLIWNHDHVNLDAVLGHALLQNRYEGVYAYCKFNLDTPQGRHAKSLVENGDVRSLSIYANKLKQLGNDVIHGSIKELSLVLAGANPGAYIDFVMAHDEEGEDAVYVNYDENALVVYHSDIKEEPKEDKPMAEEAKKPEGEKTVKQVYDEFTDEQKAVVHAMIGQAVEDALDGKFDDEEDDDNKEEEEMKHNIFEKETDNSAGVLSHSAMKEIMDLARTKQVDSFQTALEMYMEDHSLQHGDVDVAPVSGFTQTGTPYNITTLFPEYKEVRPGAPELITDDRSWVVAVMSKVHKSPFTRIRTTQADIRGIEALRARGYKKGTKKALVGNYGLVRRTTDPQTVTVKSALHRDDILDVEDFDLVAYQYSIDRAQLDIELATAIMFGDGREPGTEGKIDADKIRPIWGDDPLYTIYADIDFEAAKQELQGTGTGVSFGINYIKAEAMVNACLYAREKYKGSGTPDMFIDPHELNVMLLARDMNGRRVYQTVTELAAALNVGKIYTVEQMADKTRTDSDGNTKKLHAMIVNLADYSLGASKKGQVAHFTDFDIHYNQEISLLETRCSGASTRIYSAICIEQLLEAASEDNTEDQVSG